MRERGHAIRELGAAAVRASRMAWARLKDFSVGFVVSALAGVFMALVGAFGTDDAPVLVRLVYWVPTMIAGGAVGALVSGAVATRAPNQPPAVLWAAISLGVTIPVWLIVWSCTGLAFGGRPDGLMLLGAVALVSGAMTGIMMLARPPTLVTQGAGTGATPGAQPSQPPAFLKRLPRKLMGATLYAIEAEDHYLRLHTSKGQDLILFRLADAIGELDGLDGAQTHRSWWVAHDAVVAVTRAEGRVTLALKGGAEAPVSRRNQKALKDLGWL